MERLTVVRGLSRPRSIILMGFVVVIILILDLSAGDTWSVRSTQMPSEKLLFYTILIIITIVIQIFILAFASLTVFRTKKSKSRLASTYSIPLCGIQHSDIDTSVLSIRRAIDILTISYNIFKVNNRGESHGIYFDHAISCIYMYQILYLYEKQDSRYLRICYDRLFLYKW